MPASTAAQERFAASYGTATLPVTAAFIGADEVVEAIHRGANLAR